ncbi:TK3 [Callinectes sapidus nudivirus]|nr:TK3 [Callinectes sapidus nudivirus]
MTGRLFAEYNNDDFESSLSKEKNPNTSNYYWISMGLPKICIAKNVPIINSIEDVKRDILDTNREFFKQFNTSNFTCKPRIPILSIDGTSGTGKTTLCNKFAKSIKTNRFFKSIGMNTHPSSFLGYIYTSLKLLKNFREENKDEDIVVSDRTPWNNAIWANIWKMFNLATTTNEHVHVVDSNAYTEMNDIVPNNSVCNDYTLNFWRQILETTHTIVWEDIIDSTVPLFIVDSNEEAVKQRMLDRATGSDEIRSNWPFYISVQNYAYAYIAAKFPKKICIIDINRYSNLEHSDISNAIFELLNENITLKNLECSIEFDEDESHIFQCAKLTNEGREYERNRPINQDAFCSGIKRKYCEFRNEENKSETKKQKKQNM